MASREILVEVEHVKGHTTEKDKKTCRTQKFLTEGNEKADELAKSGACWMKDSWRKQDQKRFSRIDKRCT